MEKVEHFSHGCALTSPEIAVKSICSICYKDEPVEFTCKPCNFDICEDCSKLPQKVSHDIHPEHLLEFCLHQYDHKPEYIICSGCGNMSSGSFYKCKECEIYLDLGCAVMENIFRGWDAKEMLHYSHLHLLRRCKPGQNAQGSCILCEFPVSPSSICYGCVYCYSFLHERCLQLPTEFQHPVHPAHPLKRLDYLQNLGKGKYCNACLEGIVGVPFGCKECDFDIHLRCADSLLRGLMHKSHEHRLFYVATDAHLYFKKNNPCKICTRIGVMSVDSFYTCVECSLNFHFECLEIPEFVIKKTCHIHPLVRKRLLAKNDSLEYCDICETLVGAEHHTYSCEECDFLAHIECILHKEAPWPLYLKDLYSYDEGINRPKYIEDLETEELENKLMVIDIEHIHVMKVVSMEEAGWFNPCGMCTKIIRSSPSMCETCEFKTHSFCAELAKPSTRRLHLNHPHNLTLLPKPPARHQMKCEICRKKIKGFNLFCRSCDYIIHINCASKGKLSLMALGQKLIGTVRARCMSGKHSLVQVIISSSYPIDCIICDETFFGKALSCMTCEEIYHPRCIMLGKQWVVRHPLHPDHKFGIVDITTLRTCDICDLAIKKYGYRCLTCYLSFHLKCIKETSVLGKDLPHNHIFYRFWINDPHSTRSCSVCGTRYVEDYVEDGEKSFYGCIDCNFSAHERCIGFPANVKNRVHQHTVVQKDSSNEKNCSLCEEICLGTMYTCKHCGDFFHLSCILPSYHDDNGPATDEEQVTDIYLMYLERDFLNLFEQDSE